MTVRTGAEWSSNAPRVTNSGVKCSTVGCANCAPGANVRNRESSSTSPRSSAAAAQASKSRDQPGTTERLPHWVIAAIVVRLPFLDRPLALPTGFALGHKGVEDSRLALARRLIEHLAAALPDRRIEVVADSAYAGNALRGLPATITWTTRLRSNAALYEPAPPRTGRRGRPRLKGKKLPRLAELAAATGFTATVHRYGVTSTVQAATVRCLWYGVFGPQPVQVVLVRDRTNTGYAIALVSTDLSATTAQIIERYAARWSIEVAIEDAKQTSGVGQARNRLPAAVARTVPFALAVTSLAICWYATTGYHRDDVTAARAQTPWYRDKAQPSVADMLAKLPRVNIASQYRHTRPQPVTPDEINILRLPGLGQRSRITAKVESSCAAVPLEKGMSARTTHRSGLSRSGPHPWRASHVPDGGSQLYALMKC
jgi:hypothetical protein